MKNLKYDTPFSVDMVYFKGDRGIKWFRGVFDPDQKNLIIQLIKVKLIQAVREFGLTAEDLGLVNVEYLRAETPTRDLSGSRVSVEKPISSFQFTPRTPIPIIIKQKIGGVRYG